jgi:hypothetical protein
MFEFITKFFTKPKLPLDLSPFLSIKETIDTFNGEQHEQNKHLEFAVRNWEELEKLEDYLVSQVEKQLKSMEFSNVMPELKIYPLDYSLKTSGQAFLEKLTQLNSKEGNPISREQCKVLSTRMVNHLLLRLEEILPDEKWEIREDNKDK